MTQNTQDTQDTAGVAAVAYGAEHFPQAAEGRWLMEIEGQSRG